MRPAVRTEHRQDLSPRLCNVRSRSEWRARERVLSVSETVEAVGLVKHYGDVKALDGLDLKVPQGSILGLLGPNGAGKTTAVSILTTLIMPSDGRATVAGADVLKHPAKVRKKIGLSGQFAAVDENPALHTIIWIGIIIAIFAPLSVRKYSKRS